MASVSDSGWDTAEVRRAIRLLGAHAPRVDDPQAIARVLRLVWDILQRRGLPTEIFQLPGTMPLVIAGRGPILLITHLDDPHPFAQSDEASPPTIAEDVASAPGITRKAGVLSTLGAVLESEVMANRVTLIVEADRHSGSPALACWLDRTDRQFSAALCEVADIPVPAPALFLTNPGNVTLRISLEAETPIAVERLYGGVQPDIGHQLASALASLKSPDGEVLVPGFYDGVITPDADGLATLQQIAAPVGAWLMRGQSPATDQLSSSHLTLGAFLAPSIVVRDFQLHRNGPYLANRASATVETRIMPGQDPTAIARNIAEQILSRAPQASIELAMVRPPAKGSGFDPAALSELATVVPVAAGDSPAGLLETLGIATLGFSTVWRDPSQQVESVTLTSIAECAGLIQRLIAHVGNADTTPEPER